METKDMTQGKVIGNVGTLDIRKTSESTVAGIKSIGNVGALLYSPETLPLVSRLNIGNLGNSVEVPGDIDFKMLTGEVTFDTSYFKNQTAPLNLLVTGSVIVHPEISLEDVQKGLGELIMIGLIICPEHLAGAIQSKCRNLTGEVLTYTPASRFTIGKLVLDENYLRSLEDGAELVVIGKLELPQVLPNDLFAQKVKRIEVRGKVTCREENAQVLFACLDSKRGTPRVTTIPAGFQLVEQSVRIDAALLEALPSRKLYFTDEVQIERDVDPAALDKAVDALVVKGTLLCPTTLQGVVARKCNLLETKAVFYEGELWLVDGDLTLQASRFDYLEGVATLVVDGDLMIAPDIEPKVLFDRLAKVYNFGDIHCTPAQMSALQARLAVNDGDFEDSTQTQAEEAEEEEEGAGGIGNVGYLAL